ncbi:hypothetical protein F511_17079 [Dorcoceras hygrometricum]|uniref:Uncharacterized protein n=1 Tax=Dorcoceras hygrometricum TaxID=472368 RepID=A0A2Z7CPU3_9LAMI|nr:hypothetical protein F511_17079 [Dorcoceras hygrometricum]
MKSQRWISIGRRPPSSLQAAAVAARLRRKIVSGQFDEENPFVLISSVLLVQADEGVSFLVVDRIGDIYHNLPRRADVIVTTVGARHKCQQDHRELLQVCASSKLVSSVMIFAVSWISLDVVCWISLGVSYWISRERADKFGSRISLEN